MAGRYCYSFDSVFHLADSEQTAGAAVGAAVGSSEISLVLQRTEKPDWHAIYSDS